MKCFAFLSDFVTYYSDRFKSLSNYKQSALFLSLFLLKAGYLYFKVWLSAQEKQGDRQRQSKWMSNTLFEVNGSNQGQATQKDGRKQLKSPYHFSSPLFSFYWLSLFTCVTKRKLHEFKRCYERIFGFIVLNFGLNNPLEIVLLILILFRKNMK